MFITEKIFINLQDFWIENITEEDRTELCAIYQESFDKGYIPEVWTHSFLKPISNPGKDHHKLNGHRVHTMQNTIGKLQETRHRPRGSEARGNAHEKMQLYLHVMCMKDSRGKKKHWLWESFSRTHTTWSSSSCQWTCSCNI